MTDFINKVVVITGGGSGIGHAITEKFCREGAQVVIFGRDKQKLDRVKENFKHNVLAIQGDVAKISDLDNLFQKTIEQFGKIDIIIANAGILRVANVTDVNEDFFDELVNTNIKGVYFTVQRSLSYLKAGASIILISSITGHSGYQGLSVYSMSKAAVSQLARCFAADLAASGIRVNAISPGYTNTSIFEPIVAQQPNYILQNSQRVPLSRFADPVEIAEAAAFLASNKANYITGIDLTIDGGLSSIVAK